MQETQRTSWCAGTSQLAVDGDVDDRVSVQPVFDRTILHDESAGQRHAGLSICQDGRIPIGSSSDLVGGLPAVRPTTPNGRFVGRLESFN